MQQPWFCNATDLQRRLRRRASRRTSPRPAFLRRPQQRVNGRPSSTTRARTTLRIPSQLKGYVRPLRTRCSASWTFKASTISGTGCRTTSRRCGTRISVATACKNSRSPTAFGLSFGEASLTQSACTASAERSAISRTPSATTGCHSARRASASLAVMTIEGPLELWRTGPGISSRASTFLQAGTRVGTFNSFPCRTSARVGSRWRG
mmetsp:Transcript_32971/g.68934  ORF Transcript_32971/g.68934 Transcript_32971/m.68934 type:complete len:207 (+) Transcript_32971:469-1089(+)